MEASVTPRPIEGEKAQRIVDAMRSSVARRGAAGSTFDHVAREAGVSRGLLHYYFGTKERMLAEVVRRDASLRLPLLRERLERAQSADEIVDQLVASLQNTVRDDPEFVTVMLELFALARRHPEVATEVEALLGRMRSEVGAVLADKERAGIVAARGAAGGPGGPPVRRRGRRGDADAGRARSRSGAAAGGLRRRGPPAPGRARLTLSAAARRPRGCRRASPGRRAPSRARSAASRSTCAPTGSP